MQFLLTAIVRGVILYLLSKMETLGWFTPKDASPYVETLVNYTVMAVSIGGISAWSILEKYRAGLLKNSPFPPSNLPSLTTPTKDLNTSAAVVTTTPIPK